MISPQQFAALLLRLFSLWLFLSAAQITLLTYAVQGATANNSGAAYAMAVLYAVTALLLWRFPLIIATKVLRTEAGAHGPGLADASGAAAVAFIAAGLLIIAFKALTPIANYLSMLAMLLLSGQGERLAMPSLHVDGAVGLAMLAIGMMLIVRCRVFARVVRPDQAGN